MSLLYLSSITILLGSQELPDSSVIPQTEGQKKKKKHFKFQWESYEVSGFIEINLSGLSLQV